MPDSKRGSYRNEEKAYQLQFWLLQALREREDLDLNLRVCPLSRPLLRMAEKD